MFPIPSKEALEELKQVCPDRKCLVWGDKKCLAFEEPKCVQFHDWLNKILNLKKQLELYEQKNLFSPAS